MENIHYQIMKSFLMVFFTLVCQLLFSQVKDTITTTSGLKYFLTQKGEGRAIDSGAIAIQHYTLWLSNGEKLDSSRDREGTFASEYPSKNLIKGYNEALSILKVGDRGIFIMPYYLAYGEKGGAGIPAKETLMFDIEILATKKESLEKEMNKILYHNYEKDSIPKIQQTVKRFQALKEEGFKDTWFNEYAMNSVGYGLMRKGHLSEALQVLLLNSEQYPTSSNVYDSLGEAYMKLGKEELAIFNYKKSLDLNSENKNAVQMLKKLTKD